MSGSSIWLKFCCCGSVITLDQQVDQALDSVLRDPFREYLMSMLRWKRCAGLVFCSRTMSFLSSWNRATCQLCINFPRESYHVTRQTKDFFFLWSDGQSQFDAIRIVSWAPPCTSPMICEEILAESSRDQGSWSCNGDSDLIHCRVRQRGWKRGVHHLVGS